MRIRKVHAMVVLVTVEAVVIVGLTANRIGVGLNHSHAGAPPNPLDMALKYEASDGRFEENVQKWLSWVSYRATTNDMPILADCALEMKTNYIRILISHGADVDQALRCLEEAGFADAMNLIRQVQSEGTSGGDMHSPSP